MSKIGSWVLELQEKKKETRQLNPYDRHSNKDNSSRQYYVDYIGHRNQHQARHDLVRSH